MKLILSRKGFDSSFGGIPSPILPDGTLLSFPIPDEASQIKYSEIFCKGKSYLELLQQLNPKFNKATCHLDPDIYAGVSKATGWQPAFGQTGAALTHLYNQNVSVGDIFLFYGWYRQTDIINGRLRYTPKAADLHVIYGYLQVGKIFSDYDKIKQYKWHPHADPFYASQENNALFLPSTHFMDSNLCGYGTFSYHDSLVLTKSGYSRSKWQLPECLRGKKLTYHDAKNQRVDYFQSAMKGQEFVCDCDEQILEWIKLIVEISCKESHSKTDFKECIIK